ncbi:major histocompatibility complex class I-related gene protein-like isoform X2 [Phyllobates terribilis]|uniref:major histocompatibility complex class I-related gene protein-like isoform X2 n=1 Tax=Phyllobates terribilis TaxID=111132 RepID=UPI003CCB3CAE
MTYRMEKVCAVTVMFLSVSGAYSDSHSLRYYYTGVSVPLPGIPEFSIIGYLDDQLTELYSSDIQERIPVAAWMKEYKDPEYWERTTQVCKRDEALFRHEVKTVMKRFNHTGGLHIVQVMTSCELRDDGSVSGYQQYRYDGTEYMFFDTQRVTYIPTMREAEITTQRWNSLNVRMGEAAKNFLENTCIDRLKKFIKFGKEDLERRVRPRVKVTGRVSGKVTKLHCQVYGFHPRAVDVKWMKNGEDEVHSYETTHVLPNPDGTYQIRVSAEVTPKEGDRYSCYVDHSSLEEELNIVWDVIILEKKSHGQSRVRDGVLCDYTAPTATSEASTSTTKRKA